VSYHYVCEPCREALGLQAEPAYLNKIRRESGGFGNSAPPAPAQTVFKRDLTGKPLILQTKLLDCYMRTPAGCACTCSENGHDPLQCTGARQFKIGGRPGSGAVDRLAKELGSEPIPELIVAPHESCEVMVGHFLATWFGSSDEERRQLEIDEVARMRYGDQLKLLRDILRAELPELMAEPPYSDLVPNLRKLVSFRNKIAHSRPVQGNFFSRIKRAKGHNVDVQIGREELAEYLDLAMALQSQLSFIPKYLDPAWSAR
jgi:hypothetical protein